MLHLNPPLVVSDNVSLSGGSSCKWYINLEVPEAKALAAR
jgi:replication factor A1